MSGFDLRGQNRLLKRALFLIVPLIAAVIDALWPAWTQDEQGFRSSFVGSAGFIMIAGFALLAIAAGLGVPRLWMRVSDTDRRKLLTGSLALNVLGWSWLASAFFGLDGG